MASALGVQSNVLGAAVPGISHGMGHVMCHAQVKQAGAQDVPVLLA